MGFLDFKPRGSKAGLSEDAAAHCPDSVKVGVAWRKFSEDEHSSGDMQMFFEVLPFGLENMSSVSGGIFDELL